MRVLVTGGAGYVGSVSVRMLLDAGHEVTVLDTLERGHAWAVDPRARFVQGDVGEAPTVHEALDGAQAVLHCAGYIEVAESVRDPERYFENNTRKPQVLLDAMHERGVEVLVFSSTAAVYGEPECVPIEEDAPLRPINPYGASKLAFERAIDAAARAWGLRWVALRYFNVAGAMPDATLGEAHDPESHIIPRILRAIARGERCFEVFGGDYSTPDGTCVRDYIHVCDLGEAHRLALEHLAAGGASGAFNLGNGSGYSNLEVVRMCAEVTGVNVAVTIGPRRSGDPAVLVASAARARAVLGWEPASGDLRVIIEDAWRWHASRVASEPDT